MVTLARRQLHLPRLFLSGSGTGGGGRFVVIEAVKEGLHLRELFLKFNGSLEHLFDDASDWSGGHLQSFA